MENPEAEKQQPSPKCGDLPEGLILVSSGSETEVPDDDHEEGEIHDDDCDIVPPFGRPDQLGLEDISSEEELNIRERMAALEAMDKKVELMTKIVKRQEYEYLQMENAMNGKENYYYYYDYLHPYRELKSRKLPPKNKADSHDLVVRHGRKVAPKRHHGGDKVKEKPSKRYSHRRQKRRKHTTHSSMSSERRPVSSDSEPETSPIDREYLKRACGIENGKTQRLQGDKNPLKKKLFQQVSGTQPKTPDQRTDKSAPKASEDVPSLIVVSSSNEADEEQEELQLRLLALSTKPKRKIISELRIPSPPPPPSILDTEEDFVSAEEHELRMIALKTAILKKHEARLARNKELFNEQPYSPSDDIALSPVREFCAVDKAEAVPQYSDDSESVEIIDDDPDVQIIENNCEPVELGDTDDNGNDMEISPVVSPRVILPEEDLLEASQQPIDMELASSENSRAPSPVFGENESESGLLLGGADSCDSVLFHRRGDVGPQTPPITPDSMEEAEADALRHLLLTKMRQKQNRKQMLEATPDELLSTTEAIPTAGTANEGEQLYQTLPDASSGQLNELSPMAVNDPVGMVMPSSQADNPNLITLVNRKVVRKRRKKSLSHINPAVAKVPAKTLALDPKLSVSSTKSSDNVIRTQKLVVNANKLINLNHNVSPSPPPLVVRTESPKNLTTVDTFVSRPVPKLVIQLGNSDSDSDVDFGSPSPVKGDGGSVAANGTPLSTSSVQFKEQLDKFLKSVRSKSVYATSGVEDDSHNDPPDHGHGVKASQTVKQPPAKNIPRKPQSVHTTMSTMTTSTAVKHLPKSAQMEYMRLLARMEQLEKHKLMRQSRLVANPQAASDGTGPAMVSVPELKGDVQDPEHKNTLSIECTTGQSTSVSRRKLSGSSTTEPVLVTKEHTAGMDSIDRKIQLITASLPNMSEQARSRLLSTAEKQLARHSESLLTELEEHNEVIVDAQQIRRERYELENRIDLMRRKLVFLERALDSQRRQSNDTFSKLSAKRQKVVSCRKRSAELKRLCYHIGRAVMGETYQLPSSTIGAQVQEQLNILLAESQRLKSIRKLTLEEFKEQMIAKHRLKQPPLEPSDGWQDEKVHTDDAGQLRGVDPSAGSSTERDRASIEEREHPNEVENEETDKRIQEPSVQTAIEATSDVGEFPKQVDQNACEIQSTEPIDVVEVIVDQDAETELIPPEQQDAAPTEVTMDEGVLQEETISCNVSDPMDEEPAGLITVEGDESVRYGKYTSPLLSLHQGAQNIPTGILCPYELGGQCVDRDCRFEHFCTRST